MNGEDAFNFINSLVASKNGSGFSVSEKAVFLGIWEGKTYPVIAEEIHFGEQSVKEIGVRLFNKISEVSQVEIKIQKNNFKISIEKICKQQSTQIVTTPKPILELINPFIPQQGRVEDARLFFGRQREIQRIFEVLNSGSSVVIVGEEGIGKSSLLWAICQQTENQLQRQPVFLDLNWVHDEEEFYKALCFEIGIPESKGYMLTRNLRDKRVLLAIDNVGKLSWQGFTRQILANPGEDFLLDYMPEALDQIYDLTHGQPYLVQLVGFQLVRRYNDQVFEQGRPRESVFTVDDVEAVINNPEFFQRGRYYFDGVWGQAAQDVDGQQEIIRVLAPHVEGLSFDVLAESTGMSGEGLQRALDTLKRHDVVEEVGGGWRIMVELFRRWVVQWKV